MFVHTAISFVLFDIFVRNYTRSLSLTLHVHAPCMYLLQNIFSFFLMDTYTLQRFNENTKHAMIICGTAQPTKYRIDSHLCVSCAICMEMKIEIVLFVHANSRLLHDDWLSVILYVEHFLYVFFSFLSLQSNRTSHTPKR